MLSAEEKRGVIYTFKKFQFEAFHLVVLSFDVYLSRLGIIKSHE